MKKLLLLPLVAISLVILLTGTSYAHTNISNDELIIAITEKLSLLEEYEKLIQQQEQLDDFVDSFYPIPITQNDDNITLDLTQYSQYSVHISLHTIEGEYIENSNEQFRANYYNVYYPQIDTSYLDEGEYVLLVGLSSSIKPTLLFPFEI